MLSENMLMACHMKVLLKSVPELDAGRTREIMDNFEIACPNCEKPVPFEPRSLYRMRKSESVQKRFLAMTLLSKDPAKPDELREMSEAEGSFLLSTCNASGALCEMLAGDFPLELLRESTGKVMDVFERQVKSTELSSIGAEAMRLMREIAAIAEADIGEREDMVDSPSDELKKRQEEGSRELIMSIENLAKPAPTGETVAKQELAKPPAARDSKCFIATAACGTPDHPLVETMRDFRNRTLARNKPGRAMVRFYERYSPPVAEWISARPIARRVVRACVVRPLAFWATFLFLAPGKWRSAWSLGTPSSASPCDTS